MSDSLPPHGLHSPRNSPGHSTGVGSLSLLQGIFPSWGSNPPEPPEKPKNTAVGSLSLLQWIFPTQESNWGLLPCRQILYKLSYPGSPNLQHGECLYCGCSLYLCSEGRHRERFLEGCMLPKQAFLLVHYKAVVESWFVVI